jgi:hypothetical protein
MAMPNLVVASPAELTIRVKELEAAVTADETAAAVNGYNGPGAVYTVAGAIAIPGTALLLTGATSAMTLAQPVAGAVSAGGNDFQILRIVALDAHAYTVTTSAAGINGNKNVATCEGAIGDAIDLVAYNGVWYAKLNTTGTAAFALSGA